MCSAQAADGLGSTATLGLGVGWQTLGYGSTLTGRLLRSPLLLMGNDAEAPRLALAPLAEPYEDAVQGYIA